MSLRISGLQKTFDGVVALAGVDIDVTLDKILGIVGPNGSGKTTLVNVVTGTFAPTAGHVTWEGVDITGKPAYAIARLGITRSFQQAMTFSGLTVEENVQVAWDHRSRQRRMRSLWTSPDELLELVGLSDFRSSIAGALPFGNARQLGIAICLATLPKLIFLDEPGAGLSDAELEPLTELIKQLHSMGIGVCIIDHNMNMISALCHRLVVLDFGTKIAEGAPSAVLNDPKVREVYLGEDL
jgi:branched-chain amino acid transport system ATP-binding protein